MQADSVAKFLAIDQWTKFFVSRHALHEKGFQNQIAVGTLVNSRQQKALAIQQLNWWSTAGFVPPLVETGFLCSCLRGVVQNSCLWYLKG
jgi:hypothetical protein